MRPIRNMDIDRRAKPSAVRGLVFMLAVLVLPGCATQAPSMSKRQIVEIAMHSDYQTLERHLLRHYPRFTTNPYSRYPLDQTRLDQ